MVDYILHCGPRFHGATVLELGSGVGLVGVAAALLTRHVFCTGEHWRRGRSGGGGGEGEGEEEGLLR